MAEIKQVFPLPPDYYKHYTSDNLNSEECQPPKPVSNLDFTVFGVKDNIERKLASLVELGISPLPDSANSAKDTAEKLKQINHSILLNFVRLVDLLVSDTSLAIEKIEHIRLLLIHFHHTLNEYRPHQARDTLILIMKEQIERKNEQIEEIRRKCSLSNK